MYKKDVIDHFGTQRAVAIRHSLNEWWTLWQASRADIEITAPKFIDSREALAKGFTVDYSNGFGDGMDAYEENIRAAGVKVKE
ncbi:TPA: hypothetical protein L4S76_001853 [Escherichia coli]|nr:hypothetical protein [Escherichia coli]